MWQTVCQTVSLARYLRPISTPVCHHQTEIGFVHLYDLKSYTLKLIISTLSTKSYTLLVKKKTFSSAIVVTRFFVPQNDKTRVQFVHCTISNRTH